MATSGEVDEWIRAAPESQRAQLRALRALILAIAPDASEELKWGQPCYRRKALFCHLQRAKKHVSLGFQKGALMSDPDDRLLGNGRQMRHVRFLTGDEIDTQLCKRLIEEALRLD